MISIVLYGRNDSYHFGIRSVALLFSRLPVSWVHAAFDRTCCHSVEHVAGRCRLDYLFLAAADFLSFGHLRVIVFDQMLPRTANYRRRPEVAALMEAPTDG
jgi:hypothetical protein